MPHSYEATDAMAACDTAVVFLTRSLDPTNKMSRIVEAVGRWTRSIQDPNGLDCIVPEAPKKAARLMIGRPFPRVVASPAPRLFEHVRTDAHAVLADLGVCKIGQFDKVERTSTVLFTMG